MIFVEPKTGQGRKARTDFFRRLHSDLPKGNACERGTYCHAHVMKTVRERHLLPEFENAKMILFGSEGFYHPAHSIAVNASETKIIADTFSGVLVDGKYRFHYAIGKPEQEFSIYYVATFRDLWEWSQAPLTSLPPPSGLRKTTIKAR